MPPSPLLCAVALPLVALAHLSGCGAEGDPALPPWALEDFEARHTAVYDVYGLGVDRDAIHDHLAGSFAGEALTREYVEHYTTLRRMADEGTSVKIVSVRYDAVDPIAPGPLGPRVAARWEVSGIVTHQGHSHARTNRYTAVFTLARTRDGVRIVDTRMKDLERIETPQDQALEFVEGRRQSGEGKRLFELLGAPPAPGGGDE